MTEQKERLIEYAETFIGECIVGDCDRPATVRVYEDFVLCALHHTRHEIGQDQDEAGIALELMAGWRSVAAMHGLGYLLELFEHAKGELLERKGQAERRMEQIDAVDRENLGSDETRLSMGKKRREREEAAAEAEPAASKEDLGTDELSEINTLAETSRVLAGAVELLSGAYPFTDEDLEGNRKIMAAISGAEATVAAERRRRLEGGSAEPENGPEHRSSA